MISDEYAAGFFDADGCIYARPASANSFAVNVCISSVDRIILEEHQLRWGGSISSRKMPNDRVQQQYQWVLASKMAEPYISAIMPFAIIKYKQLSAAMKIREIMNLPLNQKMLYGNVVYSEDHGRYWSRPILKPEYAKRIAELREEIRSLNKIHAPINARRLKVA